MAKALTNYTKTITPSEDFFVSILNQIPEKKIKEEKPVVKSPYVWITLIQVSTICAVLLSVYPNLKEVYTYRNNSFYLPDKQVDIFESKINNEDYNTLLDDINL